MADTSDEARAYRDRGDYLQYMDIAELRQSLNKINEALKSDASNPTWKYPTWKKMKKQIEDELSHREKQMFASSLNKEWYDEKMRKTKLETRTKEGTDQPDEPCNITLQPKDRFDGRKISLFMRKTPEPSEENVLRRITYPEMFRISKTIKIDNDTWGLVENVTDTRGKQLTFGAGEGGWVLIAKNGRKTTQAPKQASPKSKKQKTKTQTKNGQKTTQEAPEQVAPKSKTQKTNTKTKTKTKKKDPNAPPGKKNAYMFFCIANREEVKTKHPELTNREITAKLAQMWRKSNSDVRKPFQEQAAEDMERYNREMKAYTEKSS